MPHPCAKLNEKDLSASIGVDFRKFHLCLLCVQVEPQAVQARSEFAHIDSAVGACVHSTEHLPKLAEPEDVEKKCVELFFLYPIVTIAILEDCLLICTHERRLVVQISGPHTICCEFYNHLVDFSEAYDVVAIVVQAAPQLFQVGRFYKAIRLHVSIQSQTQLYELVVAGRHGLARNSGVRAPLPIPVAHSPWSLTIMRRSAAGIGLHEGPTLVAIIEHLAHNPPPLACMEEVPRGHTSRDPSGRTIMLGRHRLIHIIDEGKARIRVATCKFDRCSLLHHGNQQTFWSLCRNL
mmetsp:Transcript_131104/g.327091  ORF Transcript_131104/g.327091 Transcript_131104/m.327091 type:complete len:293 (-) Transcript_131104:40-918(-)